MRQAAGLRRNVICIHQPFESAQNCGYGFHGIGRRIYSDHRIAAAVEQPFECCQQNSANIVDGMVWLDSDAQYASLAHRIPATRDIPNLCRGQDQILIAHDLGHGSGNLRNDGALDLF